MTIQDSETGLYYYRARYYDPATSRFLSEDPIGFGRGQTNFYDYVANDPTNLIDPTGNQSLEGTAIDLSVWFGTHIVPGQIGDSLICPIFFWQIGDSLICPIFFLHKPCAATQDERVWFMEFLTRPPGRSRRQAVLVR